MARLGSQQIAGYYPAPSELLSLVASTVEIRGSYRDQFLGKLAVFDPCAGDGEALMTLARLWNAPVTVGVELEAGRAKQLAQRSPSRSIHADLFQVTWIPDEDDVDLLWLNPPYDHDPDFGRLEQRFLDYTTSALRAGGALLFLVPVTALKASAEHLATHFAEIRCWRLPDPHYEAFRQVLVVAKKVRRPFLDEVTAGQIEAWAGDPDSIPVLGSQVEAWPEPLIVDYQIPRYRAGTAERFVPTVLPLPVDAIAEALRDWNPVPDGQDGDLDALLSPSFPTAAPPRPAHVALALTAGVFNGKRLVPDDSSAYPEILASGHFSKQLRQVGVTSNDDGEVTGIKRLERPHLQITVLDLATYEFHDLGMGAEPSDSPDPSTWTAGDLLKHYHRGLMGHLEEAFPILHDRRKPEHQVALPKLRRSPYPYQHEAIATALKLLAEGVSDPVFQAEVGTGKSTLSLVLAASLAPGNRQRIVDQLSEQGFDRAGDLPTVRKPLVVCPPHLIHSWKDEITAVHGKGYPVHVLKSISDVERAAADPNPAILLMARERAKLGHYWNAISPSIDPDHISDKLEARAEHRGLVACPGCGAPIDDKPARLVRRRMRCRSHVRRPINRWARLARELATILVPFAPGHSAMPRALNARTRANLVPPRDDFPPPLTVAAEAKLLRIGRRYLRHLDHPEGPAKLVRVLDGPHPVAVDQRQRIALEVLEHATRHAEWETRICGEPLFQAVAKPRPDAPDQPFRGPYRAKAPKGPRSYPLARYLTRRHPRLVDLVFLDEAHEYANKGSAQSQAAQRLAELGAPTILLTGSLMNGYASSLFTLYWMTSGPFRDEFSRSEMQRFVRRFGFLEIWEPVEGQGRGARSDRKLGSTRVKEAPGIHPSFVLDFLLRGSVVLHKDDVEQSLPSLTEMAEAIPVQGDDGLDKKLLDQYRDLEVTLLDEVRGTMSSGKPSPLLGALAQLPTFLDRATEDLGVYEVRYPTRDDGTPGRLVFRSKPLPADYITPKERYVLDVLKDHVAGELPTLVFVQNTGRPELPNRLLRLIREHVTDRCAYLDAKKVPTEKRQQWILDQVNKPGHLVLLVNPRAVSTGLNCLTRFCRSIWYQLGYESRTYRQANGRTHRIGQTQPVEILVPYYAATAQAAQFHLMSAKLETALQVDGLDIRAALEAAGAGGDDRAAAASTLSIGEALYSAMTATSVAPQVEHFQSASVRRVVTPAVEPGPVDECLPVPPAVETIEAGQLDLGLLASVTTDSASASLRVAVAAPICGQQLTLF